jgi:hypothetical protein
VAASSRNKQVQRCRCQGAPTEDRCPCQLHRCLRSLQSTHLCGSQQRRWRRLGAPGRRQHAGLRGCPPPPAQHQPRAPRWPACRGVQQSREMDHTEQQHNAAAWPGQTACRKETMPAAVQSAPDNLGSSVLLFSIHCHCAKALSKCQSLWHRVHSIDPGSAQPQRSCMGQAGGAGGWAGGCGGRRVGRRPGMAGRRQLRASMHAGLGCEATTLPAAIAPTAAATPAAHL